MSDLKKPKLIHGDDNGDCSLWDITLAEWEDYRQRINNLLYENDEPDETKAEVLEAEWRSHEIKFNDFQYEQGYVPGYVGYLAKAYDLETESN